MAKYKLLLLVILSLFHFSLQDTKDNEVDTEDINPFAEAAAAILKEQTAQNIGSMVNSFMQSGGAAKIGDAISKFGQENAGQILQGLGSLMGSNDNDESEEGNSGNVLETIDSLLGAFQGVNGGGGDALLQGLGSLLGGQQGQAGQGGLDPAMIGSFINMIANQKPSAKSSNPSEATKPSKKSSEVKIDKAQAKKEPGIDMSDLLSLAGSFLGGQNQGNSPVGNLLSYLPMILQTVSSFTGPEAKKRADSHSDHASMLPPFLEKFHVAFDNFINSDMGKYAINVMGAEKAFKVFTDDNGKFNYPKFVEMMENRSFRRHWIRTVTDRVADMLQYANDPKAQKMYLSQIQFFLNSFLKAQGFPKSTLFDKTKPTETISALVNHVAKKYFDLKIYSKEYVKAAIAYLEDLIRLNQKSGSGGSTLELSDKLADTINLEIIEPIARVNRAYRFAVTVPACDRYVLCLVNQENTNEIESLPGLKKLLYKGSSLLAGWFLSSETGTPFWTLYSDITNTDNCKSLYSEKCHDFHIEEIKVTTEYVHSEL